MKGTKKAFTIVELVIVIAVIAVLAAVLIPTFSNIIQDANVSADKSFASSFNTTLAVEMKGKEITSEAQLIEVYNKTAGGNAYADMAPKSAKQGYSYWFYVEDQRLVVAQWEGENGLKAVVAENHGTKLVQDDDAAVPQDLAWHFVTPMSDGTSHNFSPLRTFTVTVGAGETQNGQTYTGTFYLFDGTGEIVDLLDNVLHIDGEGVTYNGIINGLAGVKGDSDDPVKQLAEAVSDKLHTSVVVANGTKYVGENVGDTADYIFANNVTTIGTAIKGEEIVTTLPTPNEDLVLPESVKEVEAGALLFHGNATVVLQKVPTSENPILSDGAIDPESTTVKINAKLEAEGNAPAQTVTGTVTFESVENGEETKQQITVTVTLAGVQQSTQITLPHSNPVTDFDVVFTDTDTDTAKFSSTDSADSADYILYLSPDVTSFSLSVGNYQWKKADSNDKATPNLKWEIVSGEAFLSGEDGTYAISGLHDTENLPTVKVTETESGVSQTIKICVLRVTNYTVKINETALTQSNRELSLSYTDTVKMWEVTYVPTVYPQNTGVIYNPTLAMAENEFFEYDEVNKQLKPKTGVFEVDSTTLSFTCGNLTETPIEVTTTMEDNRSPAFAVLESVNGYNSDLFTFHIGKSGAVPMNLLFKLVDGDSLAKITGKEVSVHLYNGAQEEELTAFTGSENWGAETIDFSAIPIGTGFTLKLYVGSKVAASFVFNLVDGTNVTDGKTWASNVTNVVLLTDIGSWDNNNPREITNLYGNMHKITATTYKNTNSAHGNCNFITMSNGGTVQDVVIVGPTYQNIVFSGGCASGEFTHGIKVTGAGETTIKNSYISGFRAPIRTNAGTLNLVDTVLDGGVYCNLYVYNVTELKFHNVTMINGTKSAGIVLDQSAVNVKLSSTGTFQQYNFTTQSEMIDFALSAIEPVLKENLSGFWLQTALSTMKLFIQNSFNDDVMKHTINGDTYVHTGILVLSDNSNVNTKGSFASETLPNVVLNGYCAKNVNKAVSGIGCNYDYYVLKNCTSCNHTLRPASVDTTEGYDCGDFIASRKTVTN